MGLMDSGTLYCKIDLSDQNETNTDAIEEISTLENDDE
jgi:hypothetical protein